MEQQDVIVIGGGMVGAATALGLAQMGLQVALLEKNPLPTFVANAPYDVRISAISVASVALLQQLGAWQAIEAMRVWAYDALATWEIDGFQTQFQAAELGLDKLGFMVENNVVQLGLWQALKNYPNCIQAVGFQQLFATRQTDRWHIQLDDQRTFSAPLILACDGANSIARSWSGIGLASWQYRQHCLLAVVNTEHAHQTRTWQQFFPSGPRAFLPLAGDNGCVVWYDSPQRIAELSSLSAEKLAVQIHQHFPTQLGRVNVLQHARFPLTRQHAQQYVRQGIVLVGDAAHTINPLAGQGVNLGFKDVKVLLEVIADGLKKGEDIADEAVLKRYEQQRKPDNLLMQTGMDLLYKAFKTNALPIKIARNLGLIVAEKVTPLKRQALKYALGL